MESTLPGPGIGPEEPARVPDAPPPSRNYIVRHWRGELGLPLSYWVNGALLGHGLSSLLVTFGQELEAGDATGLRTLSAFNLLSIVFALATSIWGGVGIWRSASRHVERGGQRVWALLARVAVVFSILSVGSAFVRNNVPGRVSDLAGILVGRDGMGAVAATVQPDGTTLLLDGMLGVGSAERVRAALDEAPEVRVVRLHSGGGWLLEAKQIAADIRRRGLDTYVEGLCASACTMVFLAGKDRGATPNARIGFHRPAIAGVDSTSGNVGEPMMTFYRQAGLSETFIARVQATPHAGMWYPTRDELASNGVITRVSLGGETASHWGSLGIRTRDDLEAHFRKTPLWAAMDQRYPGTVRRAAEAAWSARERHADDATTIGAARAIAGAAADKAVRTAPDAVLERFFEITRAKLDAAKQLGSDACNRVLDGTLNVNATMPADLIKQEMAYTLQLFETPARTDRPLSRRAGLEAMEPLVRALGPARVDLINDRRPTSPRGAARCDAYIDYYGIVARLPTAQRRITLRAIFQPSAGA